MLNVYRSRRMMVTVVAVLAMSLSLSACEPLRKKFIRQKKKNAVQDNNFIPILEPQEYPAPENNPKENYNQRYVLIKSWYKDLWTALEEKASDKKVRYILSQVYAQIDEMKKLVDPEKSVQLDRLKDLLSYFEGSLKDPWVSRNVSRIQSDLRAFDRMMRTQLRVDRIPNSFVEAKQ